MGKIVFTNHASVGHLNTLLAIAIKMKEEGHEVSFLIPARKNSLPFQILKTASGVFEKVEAANIRVESLVPSIGQLSYVLRLPCAQKYKEIKLAIRLFSSGLKHFSMQLIKIFRENKPDVIVTDFAFFASTIAAEALKIPFVSIYHSGLPFRGVGIPPFGSGLPISKSGSSNWGPFESEERRLLQDVDKKINGVREKFGLSPVSPECLRHPLSPWLNLITSHESIEAPRNVLGNNTFFIGTCFSTRKNSDKKNFPFEKIQPEKFKIYVSLGTVFNNKPEVFKKIISALNQPDFQIIVSAGGAYNALMREKFPEHVMLFPSVPQVDVLPLVDLVIGHGGNNSTNETLASGKPLIILPVGGEQGDNSRRIEYLGVGKRLDIDRFTETELLTTVLHIRHEKSFWEKASFCKSQLEETDGPSTASSLIDWISRWKAPCIRPESFPLTITRGNIEPLLTILQGKHIPGSDA